MASFAELWSTVKPLWEPAKALYKNISNLASLLALPTLSKYFYDKWKKKRQMPELACNMIIEKSTLIPQGEVINTGRGRSLIKNGTVKVHQKCVFNISNVSEHIALKLRITNRDMVTWDFPLDSTKVLKGYEDVSLVVFPYIIVSDSVALSIDKNKTIVVNELIVEYRNTSGKKYQLTFRPNETDIDKRNVCIRV